MKTLSMYLMNQKERQSFHWNKSQCSIHPAIIIKMSQLSLKRSNLVLYQKSLTLHLYLKSWVKFVKGNHMHIRIIKYFSYGCAVQYKNYKYFLNLCHHYSDFDLEAEIQVFKLYRLCYILKILLVTDHFWQLSEILNLTKTSK